MVRDSLLGGFPDRAEQLKRMYSRGRRYGRFPPVFQPTVSLQAFVRLETMRAKKTIGNWYEVQKKYLHPTFRTSKNNIKRAHHNS